VIGGATSELPSLCTLRSWKAAMLDAGERAHQPRHPGHDQVRAEHDDERQEAVAGTAQADQAREQGDDTDDGAQGARGGVSDDRVDELEDARHQQVEAEDDPDRQQRDVGVDDGQHAAHERHDAQHRQQPPLPCDLRNVGHGPSSCVGVNRRS
jgi:hypothetical protein